MFQTFTETASPDTGPARLTALRAAMAEAGVDGFLVPRADAFQGEYVAPADERLSWLTGFTGSAGWAVALAERAAVFVDGRYRVQVKAQVAEVFEKVDWPETSLADWIGKALPKGVIGFDPWLLTVDQMRALETAGVALERCANLVDVVWTDRPAPPMGAVFAQPVSLSGEPHEAKIARLAASLGKAAAAVITLPDSIAWLLNIRGSDIPRNPVPHGFALLHADETVTLFMAEAKLTDVRDHLGAAVTVRPVDAFEDALHGLGGPVQIDPATCPVAVLDALDGREVVEGADPCILPKARKNAVELEGSRAAHLRDAAAMVRFLAWLDREAPGDLTEISVVQRLEEERRATNALRDISFETISGSGPHGAIVHYRVTEGTDRPLQAGELLLVDSGGQYVDGTTDITRTVAIGTVGDEERQNFTRVLKGMIAISTLRFPKGLTGQDIDPFARHALWQAGLDYGHGTGHGVGSYLCVHEGPARISRAGTVPFEPGMILSNEPGFYREGAYGIRIENLIAVEEAPAHPGQTIPQQYRFETLTWVPIDRRLIVAEMLTEDERDWVNAYHAQVETRVRPLVDDVAGGWLSEACQSI
ncbi:aminopeptidase P family protein [Primorskyibacter sp. 2E107]|uniref:aminopeptidase P family protein n=1 Tax=Primorskyibacter sp. 2E107 TaxID=3403458 RepID=UPI003AF7272B